MCQPVAVLEQKQQSRQPIPVCLGGHTLTVPSEKIGWLRDSNDLFDDADALRARLTEEGYLLLRGLIRREHVLAARRAEQCERCEAPACARRTPPGRGRVP